MKNIWTFGDSFTEGNGCLPNELYTLSYKKSNDDLIWNELVANHLGFKLINLGFGRYSNDKIIDSIIKNYKLISKEDIVIIGSTFYNRFDVPYDNKLLTISPTNLPADNSELLLEMIPIMDSVLLKNRQLNRFSFLIELFKSNDVSTIFWEVETQWLKYESIKDNTFDKIKDLHWSYKGHKEFSKYILNRIDTEKK
jgi:hypothetical protein